MKRSVPAMPSAKGQSSNHVLAVKPRVPAFAAGAFCAAASGLRVLVELATRMLLGVCARGASAGARDSFATSLTGTRFAASGPLACGTRLFADAEEIALARLFERALASFSQVPSGSGGGSGGGATAGTTAGTERVPPVER